MQMILRRRTLAVIFGFAALFSAAASRAQVPTWTFEMLSGPPSVAPTTGVTPFDRAILGDFGAAIPVPAGLAPLSFVFDNGSPLSAGKVEIGGLVLADVPGSGAVIYVVPGGTSNEAGTDPLNDLGNQNGNTDFFEENTADITDPNGDPTWTRVPINAGFSMFLDMGTLDLSKLLAFSDARGVGVYHYTLDLGVAGYNAVNDDPLDPDPNNPGNSLPRIPGPPTIDITVTVNSAVPQGPVPEPGSMAALTGMVLGGFFALRRKRR